MGLRQMPTLAHKVSDDPEIWIRADQVVALEETKVRTTLAKTFEDGSVRTEDRTYTLVGLTNGNTLRVPDQTPTDIAYKIWYE